MTIYLFINNYTNNPLKSYYADNLLTKRKLKEKKIIKQKQEKFIEFACADSIRVVMVT